MGDSVTDEKFLALGDLLVSRVRYKDLPLVVLFGIGHWMANALDPLPNPECHRASGHRRCVL